MYIKTTYRKLLLDAYHVMGPCAERCRFCDSVIRKRVVNSILEMKKLRHREVNL